MSFKCPDCGSTHFGSSSKGGETTMYHCHGYVEHPEGGSSSNCKYRCTVDYFEKHYTDVDDHGTICDAPKKNILIGITGSISAYKTLDVISALRKRGHNVKCIMTDASKLFATEMSVATISNNRVVTSFDQDMDGTVAHVELANWADVVLIAPATANTLAKLVNGTTDNPLMCTLSVFSGKRVGDEMGGENVVIAPAMNTNMLEMMHAHISTLECFQYTFVEPQEGVLACGEVGNGKLAKPEDIVKAVLNV